MEEFNEYISEFISEYTADVIEEDTVGFYNDTFMLFQYFIDNKSIDLKEDYESFISHVIKNQSYLKEYTSYDFTTVATYDLFQQSSSINELKPVYTPYSFSEVEEMISQIFEELKSVKEFQKELKEEIKFILEEYEYHVDHLEENMKYNFYSYEEFNDVIVEEFDSFLEEFTLEKKKFIQSCNDKLSSKK